ncbi:MAG TPA: inner membrane protein YpjD, partial [Burkholderiales bacterium]
MATAPGAQPQRGSPQAVHYFALLPLTLHALTLAESAFAADGLHLGVGTAISAILWLTVLIYWLGNFVYRLEGLQALVMPLAALAVVLPLLLPEPKPLPNTELFAFKIHLLIAILAYSLFTIASLHVLLMTLLERR